MYYLLRLLIVVGLLLSACSHQQSFCNGTEWFNDDYTEALRSEENVINLACIGDGWVKYHKASVKFNKHSPWKIANDISMKVEIQQTNIVIVEKGQEYVLNTFQPFIFQQKPNVVYLVDEKGNIWTSKLENLELVMVSIVRKELPIFIPPNPNLTLSYNNN